MSLQFLLPLHDLGLHPELKCNQEENNLPVGTRTRGSGIVLVEEVGTLLYYYYYYYVPMHFNGN